MRNMYYEEHAMKTKKKNLNEVVEINGSKVFVDNGEVKTILSETIQQSGYMSIEDAKKLTVEKIRKIYKMNTDD